MTTAPHDRSQVLGVILAGGRSSRMGTPKQNVSLGEPFAGRTMIEAVADALEPLCREIVIAGTCDALPYARRVPDRRSHAGPLGGIEAVLELLSAERGGCALICPCDVPLMTPELLLKLLQVDRKAAAVAIRLEDEPLLRPLPVLLDVRALEAVRRLLNENRRSVRELLHTVCAAEVVLPLSLLPLLHNVNAPDDLVRLGQVKADHSRVPASQRDS